MIERDAAPASHFFAGWQPDISFFRGESAGRFKRKNIRGDQFFQRIFILLHSTFPVSDWGGIVNDIYQYLPVPQLFRD